MKNKRGVSLIVLVITIVVVIILAAAVILSLSGNNPINNARIANLDQTKDGIESSILAYTGKAQSQTLGYYTVAELLTGNRSETESYGITGDEKTTNKDGEEIYNIDKAKFESKIDTLPSTPTANGAWYVDGEGKVYLVYDKKDELPNWAKNKDGEIDDSFLNQFIVIKDDDSNKDDNTSKGSAKEVADNASEYYGATVTNYTANGVSDWKIFHSDGTNIYLISSDYIPVDKIPATKGGSAMVNTVSDCPKAAPLTPAVNDSSYSSGSESISSSNPARKWLKSYLDNYTSTNNNMKAVAYLLDTDVWNVYKTDKAEYAIGGPTVEMLMESYSKKMGVDYQAKAVSETGYQISKDGGENWANYYSGMLSTSETLYVLSRSSGALAMWLASPSANDSSLVVHVTYDGYVVCSSYYADVFGFRPVVSLKSEISIIKNDDGSATLK